MELKRMYDTSESPSKTVEHRADEPISNPPLSFGCNFTREQMAGIVSCANTYHLFCIPVRIEDMEALFACKEGFYLRVNTVRYVAILFDALLENTFIQSHWQSRLEPWPVLAIQGRCKVHFLLKPLVRLVRCKKQYDIGSLWYPESYRTIERMTLRIKAKYFIVIFNFQIYKP